MNLYRSGVRTFIEVGPRNRTQRPDRSILQGRAHHILSLDASKRPAGERHARSGRPSLSCSAVLGHPVHLERWGRPPLKEPATGMRIPLCGANLKPHLSDEPSPKRSVPSPSPNGKSAGATTGTIQAGTAALQQEPQPNVIPMNTKMKSNPTRPATPPHPSMEIIQEGLRSIQAIQARTAEAHQKFLETQAEASRALQAMMTGAGLLLPETAQKVQPVVTGPVAAAPSPAAPATFSPLPEAEKLSTEPRASVSATPGKGAGLDASSADRLTPPPPEPSAGNPPVDVLVRIVSDLTGYPAEMLDLDMEIEADLGIDSIKRVEILSALEERLSDLPPMEPEILGELKTLAQLADYLANRTDAAAPATESPDDETAGGFSAMLLSIVSDLTGYPADMLGMDMDIEADLGIDSIKRVEILSALEEKAALTAIRLTGGDGRR
jgi:acyl carrier protein